MRVLVAPDKFKGSLTAAQVAARVAAGLRAAVPDAEVLELPVADGGDGTVDAAVAAGYERVPARATGPTGAPVDTSWARSGDTAVVELAAVCGLLRLPGGRRQALDAGTRGLGELVGAAARAGCRHIIVGIGGSASTDGGAGMLQGLGVRVVDRDGREIGPGGRGLAAVHGVDLTGLEPALRGVRIEVACDVDNPLCGPRGAARVYGPQKGATPAQVAQLDTTLRRWADVLAAATGTDVADTPGAGAAGGVGLAAMSVLRARLRPGIDLVLDLLRFAERVAGCDLVLTGEGAVDEQTLAGKAPAGVAAAARAAGVPAVAVAGRGSLPAASLAAAGISALYTLTSVEPDLHRCMRDAGPLLERLASRVAADWLTATRAPG